METTVIGITAVLPAVDVAESLRWWTEVCGFKEVFRYGTPPDYAGIQRGAAHIHFVGMTDKSLARIVGEQTMVRIAVQSLDQMYAEYLERGGIVHPNGGIQAKPWGGREFSATDPNGVCITFSE